MRITDQTRQALEAEADRTGRSLSETAESWINEAREGRAAVEQLLGGLQVADAVRAMVAFARAVTEHVGAPVRDKYAREALVSGWKHLAGLALPFTPLTEDDIALANVAVPLKQACLTLFEAASAAHLDRVLKGAAEGGTDPDLQVLLSCYDGPGLSVPDTVSALDELLTRLAGDAAPEVKRRAIATRKAFMAFQPAWEAKFNAVALAALRGRDLAEQLSAPFLMGEAARQKLEWERYGYTANLAIGLERAIR